MDERVDFQVVKEGDRWYARFRMASGSGGTGYDTWDEAMQGVIWWVECLLLDEQRRQENVRAR
jgi:hypothetical protein